MVLPATSVMSVQSVRRAPSACKVPKVRRATKAHPVLKAKADSKVRGAAQAALVQLEQPARRYAVYFKGT